MKCQFSRHWLFPFEHSIFPQYFVYCSIIKPGPESNKISLELLPGKAPAIGLYCREHVQRLGLHPKGLRDGGVFWDILSTWKTVKVNNLTQMRVCDLDLCAIFLHVWLWRFASMGSFGECVHLPGFMLYADVGGYNKCTGLAIRGFSCIC